MKQFLPDLDDSLSTPLYVQLYQSIKEAVTAGRIAEGERLPSLRSMARDCAVSVTTVQLAYNQLLVEGYIVSRPQSGYYAAQVLSADVAGEKRPTEDFLSVSPMELGKPRFICDRDCFDFNKWKKCSAAVFNDYSDRLLAESDPQGELPLRYEIAKYLYSSRGVSCLPEQIVLGAGTQQITNQLCRILAQMGIDHVSLETPGYLPVQSMFRDNGFAISHVPVLRDGIDLQRLPVNIPSAVYVCPSNQFPTGAVMPVGKRYRLLQWAKSNDSIIVEDDYDSELRYFGKPVPALKSLDTDDRVVYLGSFSSTLFQAVKISYMVLPPSMSTIFDKIKNQYAQTCSKSAQLTLTLFMERGYYYTGLKKLRSLYSQKLQAVLQALAQYKAVLAEDSRSGINLTLRVRSSRSAEELCALAEEIGLQMTPVADISDQETSALIFYYNRIPLKEIKPLIVKLAESWGV